MDNLKLSNFHFLKILFQKKNEKMVSYHNAVILVFPCFFCLHNFFIVKFRHFLYVAKYINKINQMSTEKCQKGANFFICEKCNFKCNKKYNYNKHILTAKHNNQQNQQEKCQKGAKNAKNYNNLLCNCGKTYKDRSGLWRHKKNCEQINANAIVEREHIIEQPNSNEILSLISQNKELMDLLHEQNKIIKEMVPKIGNNNTTNNHK